MKHACDVPAVINTGTGQLVVNSLVVCARPYSGVVLSLVLSIAKQPFGVVLSYSEIVLSSRCRTKRRPITLSRKRNFRSC